MTKSVDVNEAKMQLSRLLDEAAAGEEIVIVRAGRPVARLVATELEPRPRGVRAGVWPDLDPDGPFFEPLPAEELEVWDT